MTPQQRERSQAPRRHVRVASSCSHAVNSRGQYDAKFQTVTNGLNAARVAAAASTLLAGGELMDEDRSAVGEVVKDLRDEALALRHPQDAKYGTEGSFAFAGLALKSFPEHVLTPTASRDADYSARLLDQIASELDTMLGNDVPSPSRLKVIKETFLAVSQSFGRELAQTGELVDTP
jgi:hypothetical protein